MAKRPSMQLYPGDWRRDAALQSCSVPARGLWFEMLCLMHDGYPYGYLRAGKKVIQVPTLARMVGCEISDCERWLAELEEADVFSRDQDGAIYSRRLVRDEDIRNKRVEAGRKGGNPALKKKNGKPKGKPHAKKLDNQKVIQTVADEDAEEDIVLSLSSLIQIWNRYALQNGMIQINEKTITHPTSGAGKKRHASALARLQEHPDLEEWETVVRRIMARPHCRGENDRGWVADFEYLLRPDTFDNHITGKFAHVEKRLKTKSNPAYTGMTNEPDTNAPPITDDETEALVKHINRYAKIILSKAAKDDISPKQRELFSAHGIKVGDLADRCRPNTRAETEGRYYDLHDEFIRELFFTLDDKQKVAVDNRPDERVNRSAWAQKQIEELFGIPRPTSLEIDESDLPQPGGNMQRGRGAA